MDVIKEIQKLRNDVQALKQRRISRRDVVRNEIKQNHIDGLIIFRGEAADRPTDGSTEVQAYFAEDTSHFSIWNTENSAWESVTLA